MSRKHFIVIAGAIRNNLSDRALRQAVATALIPALMGRNPNFNVKRFLAAAVGE